MTPDYVKFVNDFCKPVVMLSMFMIMCFVVAVGWQIWKENLDYRRRLGRD